MKVMVERGARVVVLAAGGGRGPRGGGKSPRNALIRRADGSLVVRPYRGLRRPPDAFGGAGS